MEKLLEGRTAIVTGGSSGIGAATARLYATHGANVIVSDLNEKAGNEIVSRIKDDGGKAVFVKTDVSRPVECENLVQQTLKILTGLTSLSTMPGLVENKILWPT